MFITINVIDEASEKIESVARSFKKFEKTVAQGMNQSGQSIEKLLTKIEKTTVKFDGAADTGAIGRSNSGVL